MTSVLATESGNPSSAAESVAPPWTNPQVRARCWIAGFVFPAVFIALPTVFISILFNRPLPTFPNFFSRQTSSTPQVLLLFLTLTACAITDWRWKKIPNWATYPALVWLILIAVFHSVIKLVNDSRVTLSAVISFGDAMPPSPLAWLERLAWLEPLGFTLLGGFACFCVMFFVFRMAGGGAGDVKLATVIGAALGAELGFAALIASYIVAAVGILTWLAWTVGPRLVVATFVRKLGQTLIPASVNAPKEAETRILQQRVALGPFFAAGTLIVILQAAGYWSWS